jgi:hypothetical protein
MAFVEAITDAKPHLGKAVELGYLFVDPRLRNLCGE